MLSGTRQKSYVPPSLNLILILELAGSYPTAEIAEEGTGIMFMLYFGTYQPGHWPAYSKQRLVHHRSAYQITDLLKIARA
jgi:hypothetical protein